MHLCWVLPISFDSWSVFSFSLTRQLDGLMWIKRAVESDNAEKERDRANEKKSCSSMWPSDRQEACACDTLLCAFNMYRMLHVTYVAMKTYIQHQPIELVREQRNKYVDAECMIASLCTTIIARFMWVWVAVCS